MIDIKITDYDRWFELTALPKIPLPIDLDLDTIIFISYTNNGETIKTQIYVCTDNIDNQVSVLERI